LILYRHRQVGWRFVAVTLAGFAVAVGLSFTLSPATRAAVPWLLHMLYGLLLLALLLFSTLTVTVAPDDIRVRLGVGLYRRTIALADVVRCAQVRIKSWRGVGLRWTPAGWLYNIGAREAVRLELARERAVMIGTDDAPRLLAVIDAQLRLRGSGNPTT
jgi:hypothetical protein